MVPTPTDRMEFRKSTPDLKVQSAAKEHSSEVRGGGRDPGVGRPGAGPGQQAPVFFSCGSTICSVFFLSSVPHTHEVKIVTIDWFFPVRAQGCVTNAR